MKFQLKIRPRQWTNSFEYLLFENIEFNGFYVRIEWWEKFNLLLDDIIWINSGKLRHWIYVTNVTNQVTETSHTRDVKITKANFLLTFWWHEIQIKGFMRPEISEKMFPSHIWHLITMISDNYFFVSMGRPFNIYIESIWRWQYIRYFLLR